MINSIAITMFAEKLSLKKIFTFWMPLSATWLMMATEGPFLAAVIARMAEPKYNLAAYGVALSFALLIEAPIIMIMSASTALVKDRNSYCRLRRFTYVLNGVITGVMIILIIPPVFTFITQSLIGLPDNVAKLTHYACILLIPWPAAIGYRRFFQGILIRNNHTRRVAYGTIVRLSCMATAALITYRLLKIDGALVGAAALSVGVVAEAAASRFMALASVKKLLRADVPSKKPLTYSLISKFYYPLAVTSVLALGVMPMVTFFMGQSKMSLESLAVLPVINALVFIFRSFGLSYQEVSIALLDKQRVNYKPLRNFALILGAGAVMSFAVINLTPLSFIWFHDVSGLSLELTRFALLPTLILIVMPGLEVLLNFQRAVMVSAKRTLPITLATALELGGIILILIITTRFLNLIGAIAAAVSMLTGRLLANGYLFSPVYQALKKGNGKPGKATEEVSVPFDEPPHT